jgi:general secretion pathway protein A
MYTDFYGLIREPFRTTPDADAIFLSPSHREALGTMLYGIKERKGVILVTGEVGVGKTTILRRYLQITAPNQDNQLHQKTIHLYNSNVTFERLLAIILQQLGADIGTLDTVDMVERLHELAKEEYLRGGTVVLVIDEAQCMPVETLDGIRMLTNLETANEKLIQIVLVGQPKLEALLERHELRHVRERIAVRGRILPLTKSESYAYIQHRLDQASREQVSIFSSGALDVIVKAARGIPQRLNIFCDNALMTGFREREPMISRKIAKHVTVDTDGSRPSVAWGKGATVSMAVVAGLSLSALVYVGSQKSDIPWATLLSFNDASSIIQGPAVSNSNPVHWSGSQIASPAPVNAAPMPQQELSSTGRLSVTEDGPIKVAAGDIATPSEMEAGETARLLAVLLDSGRVVLGKAQSTINNPRLEDKGFSGSVFEARLRKEFLGRTGHDLSNLKPAAMPERAKPLLMKLASYMTRMVQEVQPEINKKGVGFKGFIPATFATRVADRFSKESGLKLRQIGPPAVDPRNPNNKPDEQEEEVLLAIQKSHPRAGDHVIEQRFPDKSVRVLLPLFYTKACLSCHGKPKGEIDISGYEKEGFKEGDLGGAISVVLPSGDTSSDGQREG